MKDKERNIKVGETRSGYRRRIELPYCTDSDVLIRKGFSEKNCL
jgi:hypothetical protein